MAGPGAGTQTSTVSSLTGLDRSCAGLNRPSLFVASLP